MYTFFVVRPATRSGEIDIFEETGDSVQQVIDRYAPVNVLVYGERVRAEQALRGVWEFEAWMDL
jgi:hypothetical protein